MSLKKKLIYIIIVVIIGIGGYFLFFGNKPPTEFNLTTSEVISGNINTVITATGTIEPITQVDVGTQVSAEVKKIYVDYNSTVKKGELIAELDKTNLKTTVLDAEASHKKALNEKAYLEKVYEMQSKLFKEELISEAEYNEAVYNLENSKNSVTQTLLSLTRAKTNLGYANIYSPINGVVLSRDVDEGQTVAASLSSPTLFTIAQDLKQMQVEADIDEADIGSVKVGQRVTFTVDAFPFEEFNGKVTQVRLNPTVTSNVVTYIVIIKAENPDMKLMPGLTATVSIFTNEVENVKTIKGSALNYKGDEDLIGAFNRPNLSKDKAKEKPNAIIPKSGEKKIWVIEDSIIKARIIKVGVSDGVNIEVLEGLELGDRVVNNLAVKEEAKGRSSSGSPFMPKRPGQK